jgi:hypothetical protein
MHRRLRLALGAGASAAVIVGAYAAGVALAPEAVDDPAVESPRQSRLTTSERPTLSDAPDLVDDTSADELGDDAEVANPPATSAAPRRPDREQREPQAAPGRQERDAPEPAPSEVPTTAEASPEPTAVPTEEPSPTEEPPATTEEPPATTEEPPASTAPPETPEEGPQVS